MQGITLLARTFAIRRAWPQDTARRSL
jgi:hypothetical protein